MKIHCKDIEEHYLETKPYNYTVSIRQKTFNAETCIWLDKKRLKQHIDHLTELYNELK